MDKNLEALQAIKKEQMIKSFARHNIEVSFMDRKELHHYLLQQLKDQITVSVGGSMTLFELGVIDQLKESDIHYLDRYQEGLSREDVNDLFHQVFHADLYITSSNALTSDGCLYNIDGNGNRVAAMIYGPKKVLVIVGQNKIFESEEEAIAHIKNVAAPANCLRLKKQTPCAKVGTCKDCLSPDRICCHYVKQSYQQNKERMHIIVINENLGY